MAFRYALFFTGGLLLLALLLDGVHRLFALGRPVGWQLGFDGALILGILLFGFQFTVIYSRLRTYSRAGTRIQGDKRKISRSVRRLMGNALTSLRTFLIFVTPEAFYGWKAEEALWLPGPRYYLPYEDLLQEPQLTDNLERIKSLASRRGGFVLSKSRPGFSGVLSQATVVVRSDSTCGRLIITSASGYKRKFIRLGKVDGAAILERILSDAAAV